MAYDSGSNLKTARAEVPPPLSLEDPATISPIEEIEDAMMDNGEVRAMSKDEMKLGIVQRRTEALAKLKFGEDIRVLCIPRTDFRLICHYLGLTDAEEIKAARYSNAITLLTLLVMETIPAFMKDEGFDFAGEINLDDDGCPVPVSKEHWTLNEKSINYTTNGFMFFERGSARLIWRMQYINNQAMIVCYTDSNTKSTEWTTNLEIYAKVHNCFRGAKLRNIDLTKSNFSEVGSVDEFTWDKYYFGDEITDLLELEVFNFVRSPERYNRLGITKRGVLMQG